MLNVSSVLYPVVFAYFIATSRLLENSVARWNRWVRPSPMDSWKHYVSADLRAMLLPVRNTSTILRTGLCRKEIYHFTNYMEQFILEAKEKKHFPPSLLDLLSSSMFEILYTTKFIEISDDDNNNNFALQKYGIQRSTKRRVAAQKVCFCKLAVLFQTILFI